LLANCTSLAPGDGAGALVTHAISRVSIRPSFQGPRRVSSLRAAVSSLGRLVCQGRLRLFFPRLPFGRTTGVVAALRRPRRFRRGAGYLVSVTLLVKVFFDFFYPLLRRRTTGVDAALSASRLFLPRGAVSSFGCLRCQRLSSLFSATYRVKCSTRVEAFSRPLDFPCRGARFLVSVAFVVKGFLPLFTALTERFHHVMEECRSAPPGSAPRGRIHGPTRRP